MDKLLIQNARVYQNGQFVRADVLCGDALIATSARVSPV